MITMDGGMRPNILLTIILSQNLPIHWTKAKGDKKWKLNDV